MLSALRFRLRREIGDADGNEHAVDRPPLAILAQQAEKLAPAGRVGGAIRILRGVAPRRIEQDRLIREPPVAVARAADAAQRFLTELLREREIQARIDDRGGLA